MGSVLGEYASSTRICLFQRFLTLFIRSLSNSGKVESSQGSLQEMISDAPIAPFVRVTVFLLTQHMAVLLQRPINPGGKCLMTAPFFWEFSFNYAAIPEQPDAWVRGTERNGCCVPAYNYLQDIGIGKPLAGMCCVFNFIWTGRQTVTYSYKITRLKGRNGCVMPPIHCLIAKCGSLVEWTFGCLWDAKKAKVISTKPSSQ